MGKHGFLEVAKTRRIVGWQNTTTRMASLADARLRQSKWWCKCRCASCTVKVFKVVETPCLRISTVDRGEMGFGLYVLRRISQGLQLQFYILEEPSCAVALAWKWWWRESFLWVLGKRTPFVRPLVSNFIQCYIKLL